MIIITVAFASVVIGTAVGLMFGLRHVDAECEKGYLAGHVDGYNKAVLDSGEVPL